MKIRNGFVSNSSSSSFVVIMKNNTNISKESLLEILKVDKESPLFNFANDLVGFIVSELEEQTIEMIYASYIHGQIKEKTSEQLIKELVDEGVSGFVLNEDILNKIKNKEIKFFEGSASNDSGDAIGNYLYENGINIETDEIIIKTF